MISHRCVLFLPLLFIPLTAWCQANINEGLETTFVYVDGVNGSDSNPGTVTAPLKTIGAAANLAETNNTNSIGTRVIINPGIYREAVTLTSSYNTTTMPITFEAAIDGTSIVSGADVWTGWKTYSGNSSIYTNTWPYAWGLCAPAATGPQEPDIVLRREMAFVNGTMMTQVLSPNEMATGTFYVDEAGGTIYLWPPSGTNINSATVEIPTRSSVWAITGQSGIVTRGLTFQNANPCRENGAVTVNGSATNILFDGDYFLWNNAQGLNLQYPVTNFTVQNSVGNHNGESGFQADMVKYGLYQFDQAAYNNWRGAQGAYYGWNSSGFHFYQMHNLQVVGLQSLFNQTHGVHFDWDNQNINVTSLTAFENMNSGLFVEVSEGPVTVSSSSFCASGTLPYTTVPAVMSRDSEFITITGSNFVNFSPNVLVYANAQGGSSITNWETGQVYLLFTQNLSLLSNVSENGASQQLFLDSVGGIDWTNFQSTFIAGNNTLWNAANSKPFSVPSGSSLTQESFTSWQTTTGQDLTSVFTQPSGNPSASCNFSPDEVDYWFLVPVTSNILTVTRGNSAVWTASVFPLRSTGTVQLSYDGIQNIPGASASWSATSLSPYGSSSLTVKTSSSTPAGTYPVTMIATSGNQTKTITALLTVQ